ncbi:MAG TPA: hypothetical protein VGT98_16225, partial [Candidatus Elarobacter sp.]|nr:hypothetical protein [Candidatus Elarobacter sp.]
SILLGSIALAGCSSGSNTTVTHNPPLSTFGGKSTARSAVQSAILIADTSTGIAVTGGPAPAAMGRRVLDVMRGRRISASTGACINGQKTSQVANADGSATITTDLYYDALCVTLEEEQVLNVITPGSSVTSANGTVTTFDRAAAVTSFHTITITASNTASVQTVNYNDSAALTVGGTAIAAVGATCTGAANSPTMTCSAAMYGTTANATFGQAIATSGTAGTGGANNSVTANIAYYGSGITGITQSAGSWVVTGASAFNSGSATYTYTSTGASGNGNLTLTDSLYTYTVTAKLAATGLTVTIVRIGDPIATATIDTAGNGLITYADGSTDTVWAEVIDV